MKQVLKMDATKKWNHQTLLSPFGAGGLKAISDQNKHRVCKVFSVEIMPWFINTKYNPCINELYAINMTCNIDSMLMIIRQITLLFFPSSIAPISLKENLRKISKDGERSGKQVEPEGRGKRERKRKMTNGFYLLFFYISFYNPSLLKWIPSDANAAKGSLVSGALWPWWTFFFHTSCIKEREHGRKEGIPVCSYCTSGHGYVIKGKERCVAQIYICSFCLPHSLW